MDDLEITRLCAEAMGLKLSASPRYWAGLKNHFWELQNEWDYESDCSARYNPLTNDAQTMALVKRFRIKITNAPRTDYHRAVIFTREPQKHMLSWAEHPSDLNRAICLAVAKMQKEKA